MASLVLALLVMPAGQSASASRVGEPSVLPQAFLLELGPAPTLRTFRRNPGEGLGTARAAARNQKRVINRVQSDVIGELPAQADVIYRTHSVLAGVGVYADPGELEVLESIPGVQAVYPVTPKEKTNAYAVPFQSAPSAWTSTGFLGQGQTIAVIDTGIDYTHSGFGGPGTVSAYDDAHAAEDQPADPALFPNAKVVGGIDLVGDSYNATRTSPGYQPVPHPDPNPLDCEGHGTHVAGSAAGYGVNADGSTYSGPYDDTTDFAAMRIGPGTAPEAEIYAIKIFGCAGSTNVVAQAIDRAVDPDGDGDPSDRVDVINLSVGSNFGSVEDGDAVAANRAAEMGVAVVASAGNAGDRTDISGSPGNAPRALSVASSVDAESKIDGATVTIDGNQRSFGVTRSALYDWAGDPDLVGTVVAAPPENETACDPYPGGTFDGEVVIVRWSDPPPPGCGSVVRGNNLAAAGASGFIFGSDAESISVGINGSATIPGVLMVAEGADAIRDALDDDLEVTVDGTAVNSVILDFPDDNDKVSGFTSRGIHAAGNLKPDVAAVGQSVFSAAVGSGDEGKSSSGTSMASPMVAGLAALVRQANPDWSPLQVKAGIMNTARHDLFVGGSADPSSDRFGPPRVGSGRIDIEDAVANKVLAYDAGNGAVSVSFGPVASDAPITLSRDVTVENLSGASVTYTAGYEPIHEVPGTAFAVTPSQVTLAAGQSTTVTVSLEITDPKQLTKAVDPTVGRVGAQGNPRQTLAEAFGRLLLEPTGTGVSLRVPVYAAPRPASTMTQADSVAVRRATGDPAGPVQTGDLELTGRGVGAVNGENGVGDSDPANNIESLVSGFALQATSGQSPQCGGEISSGCWRLPEEQAADLKMVGFTSNAPYVSNPANQVGYFAIAVHRPWAIPVDKVHFQVALDLDADLKPDLFVLNGRVGDDDTFVSVLFDPAKPAGERVLQARFLNGIAGSTDTAVYDSDVMVLPFSLQELSAYGVDAENPRISYGVETYTGTSDSPIDLLAVDDDTGDLVDPLTVNLFEPGITVTSQAGNGPLLRDQPGAVLKVDRNIASYGADSVQGLMMVHFHNEVGSKAQVVDLRRAASATTLAVTANQLTARVESVRDGATPPTGAVSFSVDGTPVGIAPIQAGVATLDHGVPPGAPRDVSAEYSGDTDFEGSANQIRRSDPGLEARVTSRLRKNRLGWYRTPVTVSFTCATSGSELAGSCPGPRRFVSSGRGLSVSRTIAAQDGGRATVHVRGLKIDRNRPVVRIRGVRRGGVYRGLRRVRCVARDRTSGVRSCRISRNRRRGVVVYRATATDRAGNRQTIRVRTRLRR